MIGERIASLRKKNKMTQRDLAKYLGKSINTISMYERNRVSPSDDAKLQLANLFHVSLDYLIGGNTERNSLIAVIYANIPGNAQSELCQILYQFNKKYGLPWQTFESESTANTVPSEEMENGD